MREKNVSGLSSRALEFLPSHFYQLDPWLLSRPSDGTGLVLVLWYFLSERWGWWDLAHWCPRNMSWRRMVTCNMHVWWWVLMPQLTELCWNFKLLTDQVDLNDVFMENSHQIQCFHNFLDRYSDQMRTYSMNLTMLTKILPKKILVQFLL